jgi:hypothetical protein
MFVIICGSVNLDKLRERYPRSEARTDCVKVGLEAIRCDLEISRCGPFQLLRKGHRVSRCAPSKVPGKYQLTVALNSDKAIGISAKRITCDVALLFAAGVAPNLIALNIGNGKVTDSAFQEPFALLAHENEQGNYCGVMEAGETLDCADRATLHKKLYRLGSFMQRRIHAAQRPSVIFGEGLAALIATESLKTVAVFSKLLAARIAVVTGHFELPFPRSKPIMFLSSALRLTPRADLAPFSVSVRAGGKRQQFCRFNEQHVARLL